MMSDWGAYRVPSGREVVKKGQGKELVRSSAMAARTAVLPLFLGFLVNCKSERRVALFAVAFSPWFGLPKV